VAAERKTRVSTTNPAAPSGAPREYAGVDRESAAIDAEEDQKNAAIGGMGRAYARQRFNCLYEKMNWNGADDDQCGS
jgi:hypothetical protein